LQITPRQITVWNKLPVTINTCYTVAEPAEGRWVDCHFMCWKRHTGTYLWV